MKTESTEISIDPKEWEEAQREMEQYAERCGNRGWTEEQDEWVRRCYGKVSNRWLAHKLGKSNSSIFDRASKLGLKRDEERSYH